MLKGFLLSLLICCSVCQLSKVKVSIHNKVNRHRPPPQVNFPQGVWSGDSTSTSVIVRTRTPSFRGPLVLEVSTTQNFRPVYYTSPDLYMHEEAGADPRESPGDWIATHTVTRLKPHGKYYYRFVSPAAQKSSPVGIIKTLPDSRSAVPVTFLHGGCTNIPPYSVTIPMAEDALDADFWIFNGDTVYQDQFWTADFFPANNLDGFRQKYRDQHGPPDNTQAFRKLFERLPYTAIWDDHEFTDDFVLDPITGKRPASFLLRPDIKFDDITDTFFKWGKTSFLEYRPRAPIPPRDQVRGVDPRTQLFKSVRVSEHVEIIYLDTRLYAETTGVSAGVLNWLPDGWDWLTFKAQVGAALPEDVVERAFGGRTTQPDYTHHSRTALGRPQLEWLLRKLRTSTAKWKFIVNGMAFVPSGIDTMSWVLYPKERQAVLDTIYSHNIENVVFLTGDTHTPAFYEVDSNKTPAIWEVQGNPMGHALPGAALGGADPSPFVHLLNGPKGPFDPLGAPPAQTLKFFNNIDPCYLWVHVAADGSSAEFELRGKDGKPLKAYHPPAPFNFVPPLPYQEARLVLPDRR